METPPRDRESPNISPNTVTARPEYVDDLYILTSRDRYLSVTTRERTRRIARTLTKCGFRLELHKFPFTLTPDWAKGRNHESDCSSGRHSHAGL
jgi:hypothetical protein